MDKRILIIAILIGIEMSPAFSSDYDASGNWERTVAFISDAKPDISSNWLPVLTADFNQTILQSPKQFPGRVDAVVLIGDNNRLWKTDAAYKNSTLNGTPRYFVIGNHEIYKNQDDLPYARSAFANYSGLNLNPGPAGTRNTTYSFDVANIIFTDNPYKIHIVSLNEYWNGETGGCNPPWSKPTGGLNTSEGCFKYDSGNGGFIPDPALFNWLKDDLNNTNNDRYYSWNIVVGHEPLYTIESDNHNGSSLDQNTTNRDKLQRLFIDYNVTVFIGAHTHTARMNITDGIYHANAGEFGPNADTNNGDNNASIFYATTYQNGTLQITWVYENGNWSNSRKQNWYKTWPH